MDNSTQNNALITGASHGLGLALARQLAQQGWGLIIDGRDPDALEVARQELAQHTRVVAITGDVGDNSHRAALALAAHDVGGLAALVNNASTIGLSPQPYLLEFPLATVEQVYRTNVFAPLALIQQVQAVMRPLAVIINVTSDAGFAAYPGWGAYGSSKAALAHLTNILAVERLDWHVYHVDPGDMRTTLHQLAFPGEDISDRPPPEESVPGLLALIAGTLPSGGYKAKEVAQ